MKSSITSDIIGGVVRAIVAAAAGAGLVSPDGVEQLAGALVIVVVAIWSGFQKYSTKKGKS